MPRPEIVGLYYYQLDTDVFSDRKIKRLLNACGHSGFVVWMYLLTEIYRDKGYYIDWTEDTAFDISDILRVPEQLVREVVQLCCATGLLDSDLFRKERILTSASIQKRWSFIAKQAKRHVTKPLARYNLLPDGKGTAVVDATNKSDMVDAISKNPELTPIDSEETKIIPEETEFTTEVSTHTIIQNSIIQNSIENERVCARVKVLFKNSIFFDLEKFKTAKPEGKAESWAAVPEAAKTILHTELLSWSDDKHGYRYDEGWIIEALKWYSRNPDKYASKKFFKGGTAAQKISEAVNHGQHLSVAHDIRMASMPGSFVKGPLELTDSGDIVLMMAGKQRLIIYPQQDYKASGSYSLQGEVTIQQVHQYLITKQKNDSHARAVKH
jgi:hypothetical protein